MGQQRTAARSQTPSRPAGRPLILAIVASILFVVLGAGVILRASGFLPRAAASQAPASRPTPAIDPRLILHAQALPVEGLLSGGVQLRGTLAPSIPGRNTLRLAVQGTRSLHMMGRRLLVVATMPGMVMRPVRATLIRHGASYSGTITLPMFGLYRARITLDTPAGQAAGTITLRLPLANLAQ